MAKAEKFEDLLGKAESIVSELESGKLDMAKSIDRYQDGLKTLKKCYELLKSVEGKIQVLHLDDEGNVTLEPFQSEDSGQ